MNCYELVVNYNALCAEVNRRMGKNYRPRYMRDVHTGYNYSRKVKIVIEEILTAERKRIRVTL